MCVGTWRHYKVILGVVYELLDNIAPTMGEGEVGGLVGSRVDLLREKSNTEN